VRDGELDDILKKTAQAQPDPDPALLDRIAASIQPNMRPVRPLPSARILNLGIYCASLAIAIAIAAKLGFFGVRAMSGPQILILVVLPILLGWGAAEWIAEMIPGSRPHPAPGTFLAVACAALAALFAILFRDRVTEPFVSQGVACLKAGLLTAIPAGLAGWTILRRGFAVNPTNAGLAAGSMAGLAGILMLELHCPNFQTWHVLVWHTAVVPVSAAIAALTARLAGRRTSGRA
jgi:hypothetical protein